MKKKLLLVICLVLTAVLLGPNILRTDVYADSDSIMDVDDNAASFFGSWPRSTNRILYYGDDYQYAVGSGSSSVTAMATFTTAQAADITGRYQVYVRWTAGTARATNARYIISDSYGDYKGECTKDQTDQGGAWQFCDEITLRSGRKGRVQLSNANVPTSKYVCADAVRFVRVSKDSDDITDSAGLDYNSLNGGVIIEGDSYEDNDTLLSKTITCPGTGPGYIIATGSVIIKLYSNSDFGYNDVVSVRTSICGYPGLCLWSFEAQGLFGLLQSTSINNLFIGYGTISKTHVFNCDGGDSVTFRFMAYREKAGTYTTAYYPSLTLTFVPKLY